MKGYYSGEKPGLSIFFPLFPSPLSEILICLSLFVSVSVSRSVFTACFPTIMLENMMQDQSR